MQSIDIIAAAFNQPELDWGAPCRDFSSIFMIRLKKVKVKTEDPFRVRTQRACPLSVKTEKIK